MMQIYHDKETVTRCKVTLGIYFNLCNISVLTSQLPLQKKYLFWLKLNLSCAVYEMFAKTWQKTKMKNSTEFTALTSCHFKFLIQFINVPRQLELYLQHSANSKWLYLKHLKMHQLRYRVQWAMYLGMKAVITSLLCLHYNTGNTTFSKLDSIDNFLYHYCSV